MFKCLLLFLIIAIGFAKPLVAQPIASQSLPTVELNREAETARYAKDIAEIKLELLQSQTSWFEILTSSMIGLLGILITWAVIFVTLRSEKLAVAEAKLAAVAEAKIVAVVVAKEEILNERDSIQTLLSDARLAVADIHQERETARELTEGMAAGKAPSDPDTIKKISNLAKNAQDKPRKERTIDDYRALVTDAFIQKDWKAMERRASAMAYFFDGETDDESISFALFYKGFALGALEKWDDAIAAYDESISRMVDKDDPKLQEREAKALFNKGVALRRLNRADEAIIVYDSVFNRFFDNSSLALQELVADALTNRGYALGKLNRANDAVEAYNDVVKRFGACTDDALQAVVARALFNKACRQAIDNKVKACIMTLTLWGERCGRIDCEKIKSDTDFDKIRNRESFKAFLAKHHAFN